MASTSASGEPLRRIKLALSDWQCTCSVHWEDRPADWALQNFDRTAYTLKAIGRLMYEYVDQGGRVREQTYLPGEYEEDTCYSVVLTLGGQEVFIEFVLRPDEEDDPGIVVVSMHEQLR